MITRFTLTLLLAMTAINCQNFKTIVLHLSTNLISLLEFILNRTLSRTNISLRLVKINSVSETIHFSVCGEATWSEKS